MTNFFYIITFGCQANKADSEKIAGYFISKGFKPAKKKEDADLIILNTCSVRKSAEDRVVGQVLNFAKLKIKNKKLKIILTGCMMRYDKKFLKELVPGVDEFVKFKDLIQKSKLINRKSKTHAWVQIMEGCNNFCTYCVVPFSRGREISRPFNEILQEVNELTTQGYKHVSLLGQNVNSYKYNFAKLLISLNNINSLEKISFMTSNPQDLSDNIIQAMKLPKIDRYLHLPVQSGDDEILRKMNRRYTNGQFLNLVKKIRKEIPEIEIGTDIIVGFPTETQKQFENTAKLCKQVKFCLAFISKYSPRPGTPAYKLKDDVHVLEKKRRWKVLNELINK